jgi:hypothetical protein
MYLTNATQGNWQLLLNHAAWVHNSSNHTALGRSPFEVLTGLKPRNASGFLPVPQNEQKEMTLEEYYSMRSEQLEELQQQAKLAIAKAQATSQEVANRHARTPVFRVNDEVWLKSHAIKFAKKKWGARYLGPYIVTEVISPQVLRVVLKSDPTEEDVVHTSYVRRKFDRLDPSALDDLHDSPSLFDNNDSEDDSDDPPNIPSTPSTPTTPSDTSSSPFSTPASSSSRYSTPSASSPSTPRSVSLQDRLRSFLPSSSGSSPHSASSTPPTPTPKPTKPTKPSRWFKLPKLKFRPPTPFSKPDTASDSSQRPSDTVRRQLFPSSSSSPDSSTSVPAFPRPVIRSMARDTPDPN